MFWHEWLLSLIGWLVTITVCAPFIWAMLFAFKTSEEARKKVQLSPLMIPAWIVTITEVTLLSVTYFDTWVIAVALISIAIIFFTLLYNQLEQSYHWFEKRLVNNLENLEEFTHARFEELAPWDTHLAQLIISIDSPLAGRSLEAAQLRQRYGINIVAIQRGATALLVPRGHELLLPYDKLIVLGNDEQIDDFKKIVEITLLTGERIYTLENFVLKTILLQPGHPWIAQSIRSAKIRERADSIVVGLERKDIRILNPDSATILEENDLLFIVGTAQSLEKL